MKCNIILVAILSILFASCTEYQKNQSKLNKAFELSTDEKAQEKDLKEAARIYKGIIDQKVYAQDRLGEVYTLLGDRSFALEQYAYAAQYYSEALKITPTSVSLHYALGITYANLYESSTDNEQRARFLSNAESNVAYALEHNRQNPNYLATLATIVGIYKDNYQEAIGYITEALGFDATNVEYLFILARIQYQLSEYDQSINTYNRIIALSKDSYNTIQNAEANIKQIMQIRQQ